MPAPEAVLQLVERFREQYASYSSPTYNETLLRRDFVDPLFAALGWDIQNQGGLAEAYRDVIHEDSLKMGAHTKAPDYAFRIGGVRKFFVETKKPSVNIADNPEPAYQLRRYGWSAKLPLCVLTDFEEFSVYDTRIRPEKGDKASQARVLYLRYEQYPERWDELVDIFSKDSILKGRFDRYADSSKKKRGTAEVDDAFLAEIESWRELLAKNIATRNPELSQRELNEAVQKTIDRIVFLRICEDRGIEDYGRLQALVNGTAVYKRLSQHFEEADERYNSGLFHFHKEKGRTEPPDEWTLSLDIDDKPLKDILRHLYYPDSPYEFSVLPADILGQVYEQFLGQVIRLTSSGRAKVEEKPEVKKAGGVYYTPTYIVRYIVENTLGKLVEGKSPAEVAGRTKKTFEPAKNSHPFTVLDPACGSGSFLLGAYQFLLDWYRDRYVEEGPSKHKDRIYQRATHDYRLTTAERKRILLDHIYGVDIDPQAVEVTKLSLLLKVLEGENRDTLQRQLRLFKQRALPDLAANIRCGNSIISSDYYEGQQLSLYDDEMLLTINAFDWRSGFPYILENGGFDAVIGNPPYGALFDAQQSIYLRSRYQTLANSLDSFLIFVEAARDWLRAGGLLGMIIPSGWVANPSARELRRLFLDDYRPKSFVSLPFDVFPDAYIDASIFVAEKRNNRSASPTDDDVELVVFPFRHHIISLDEFHKYRKIGNTRAWHESPQLEFYVTCSKLEQGLLVRLARDYPKLEEFVSIKRGIETYNPAAKRSGLSHPQKALTGTLQRYNLAHGEPGWVDYPPGIVKSKPRRYFDGPRVLLRQVLSRRHRLQAVFAEEPFLTNQSVQSLIPLEQTSHTYLYAILGVLNSKLLSWFFRNITSVARRDDFPKIIIAQTRMLPMLPMTSRVEALSTNAKELNALGARIVATQNAHERDVLSRRRESIDHETDRIVYQLFGLSKTEIGVVEELVPNELG